jgi:hypothetical protein
MTSSVRSLCDGLRQNPKLWKFTWLDLLVPLLQKFQKKDGLMWAGGKRFGKFPTSGKQKSGQVLIESCVWIFLVVFTSILIGLRFKLESARYHRALNRYLETRSIGKL